MKEVQVVSDLKSNQLLDIYYGTLLPMVFTQ